MNIFFLGAIIGGLTFLVIYGPGPLDVTNDDWISYKIGYDEWDIQQHYAGWLVFRASDWSFPLGQANACGYPMAQGANITFADAIPWVAIICKIFSPILPQTFQYEGLYELVAFSLQGGAAAILLSLFLKRWETLAIGTLFFTFSPIMMERAFRHTSLSSHYLILFAMYCYFKYRRRQEEKYPWQMLILPAVAVGITPYFLPMVEVFISLLCIEKGYKTKKYGKAAGYFALSCAVGIAAAYIIGSIGNGYSASRDGYGYYSLNLNALDESVYLYWKIYMVRYFASKGTTVWSIRWV